VDVATKPWEQRADEPTAAYEAFKVYRDLGARRSVDAVAAALGGHQEGTKRAPGHLKKWSSAHNWVERAIAYDAHQASLLQKGVDKATERQGREWAERRDRAYRDLADRWEKRLKQSDVIAAMPLVRQTVERDGQRVTIDPAAVLDHYRAVQMASRAQQRLVEVLDRGLALEARAAEATAAELTMPSAATMDGLEPGVPNKLDAWRAYQRQQIAAIRRTDPRAIDGPHGSANGTNGSGP
jgi:hypothetical protein